jgi:hypothetical protein
MKKDESSPFEIEYGLELMAYIEWRDGDGMVTGWFCIKKYFRRFAKPSRRRPSVRCQKTYACCEW